MKVELVRDYTLQELRDDEDKFNFMDYFRIDAKLTRLELIKQSNTLLNNVEYRDYLRSTESYKKLEKFINDNL